MKKSVNFDDFVESFERPGVDFIKLFSLSLIMRPNKLEQLSLETLSSQVLEFEGKARVNPIGVPFRCFLLR
jgi:hypothetical protein